MKKDALKDSLGKYRFMLMRQWGDNDDNFVNFIMLNPSMADDKHDDPTIKSCIRLAKNWGFDGLYVTNLFAFISSDPDELNIFDKPVGDNNNEYIKRYAEISKKIVLAWGNHGNLTGRDKEVVKLARDIGDLYCLKMTKLNHPMHPLYAKADTKLINY